MLYADNVMVGTHGLLRVSLTTPRVVAWKSKGLETFMFKLERVGGIGSSQVSITSK